MTTSPRTLTPQQLKELQQQKGAALDVIDVREPSEFSQGHIPGARLVPLEALKADPKGNLKAEVSYVFVCAKGGRSATAAQVAMAAGKADVFSLDGGTQGWASAGLPIATPSSTVEAAGATDAPLDAIVGENLKAHRAARGWSLDDLAREAGVSRTTLGQIELGRSPPSVGVVWKIAQTLGVHFSALLSTSAPVGTTFSERATAKKLTDADGRFSSRALFPLGESNAAEFYEIWLAPHSIEVAEAHRPGTRENLVVTAGRLELTFGKEKLELKAGDCVNFTADVPHSYKNPGSEECWMYLVMNYRMG